MQRPPIRLLLAALTCCAASAVAQQGYHVDSRIGFRLKVPHKWRSWPVEKDRRVVTGHYVQIADWPVKGQREGHRPTLRVITLPREKPGQEPKLTPPSEIPPQPVVARYEGYHDYVTRNVSGKLGWKRGEKGVIDGLPFQQWSVTGLRDDQKFVLTTWVVMMGTHDLAFEYYVHANYVVRLRERIRQSFRTFRRVKIDPAAAEPWPTPIWDTEPARWQKMALRDRQALRARFGAELLARVRATAHPLFRIKETERFILLSNADGKFTTAVGKAADSCLAWCETHFDGIGDDPVAKAVIRVFGERGDYEKYRVRSRRRSRYVPSIREIIVTPGRRKPKELGGFDSLVQGILHGYLHDKSPRLYENLPTWLRTGLLAYMRKSKLVRGELAFEASDSEKQTIRDALRRKSLEPPRAIVMEKTRLEAGGRRFNRTRDNQHARFLRFLLEARPKARAGLPETFLTDYLIAVAAAATKSGAPQRSQGAGTTPGLTDAIRKKWIEAEVERARGVLDAVNKVVCPWPAARWQELAKAYTKFNQKR